MAVSDTIASSCCVMLMPESGRPIDQSDDSGSLTVIEGGQLWWYNPQQAILGVGRLEVRHVQDSFDSGGWQEHANGF